MNTSSTFRDTWGALEGLLANKDPSNTEVACVCVYVCVCEGEKELVSVRVCVCVCVYW